MADGRKINGPDVAFENVALISRATIPLGPRVDFIADVISRGGRGGWPPLQVKQGWA